MIKITSFLKIEFKRLIRTSDLLIFAILFPIGMSLLMGAIYGSDIAFEGANYTKYQLAFSSFISIALCATGLMGIPLNISDYRDKKVLKKFKATPVSPYNILISQIIAYFILAMLVSFVIFIIAKFVFGFYFIGSVFYYLLTFIFVAVSIYSIGMLIASISSNSKVAGILTSIIYFPTIFLSGTTVPYDIMPNFIQKLSNILPMTQGIKLLEGVCLNKPVEDLVFQIILMAIISVVCIVLSLKFFKWE